MSATVNAKFKIESNIQEMLEMDYQNKKSAYESTEGNKYFRVMYYEEVADYCGISPSTVSQMKARNLFPSYIVAIKMSEWLKIPVTDVWKVVKK